MTRANANPSAPPLKAKGEATRRALMDGAFRAFAAKGYFRTQISDIANEAGRSSGVVYIYFRNKDEILDALMDECDAAVPWYQADTSLLLEKAWPFLLQSYWSLYEGHGPVLDALEAAALVSDHFQERLAQLQRRGHESIARMVRHAQATGRCLGLDPELTAISLSGLIGRTAAYWFSNRQALEARGFDREAAISNLTRLYSRMLDPPEDAEAQMDMTGHRDRTTSSGR